MQRSAAYYSQLAHACDAVLQATPLEENALCQVLLDKSSVPKIIRDLHPKCLWLSFDSVTIDIGQGNEGFWVGWGPDRTGTNMHLWTLVANVRGSQNVVYAEARQ